MSKPIKVKPSLYAYIFHPLKEIAEKYGYNLVLHGSLNRDMDLIAIPWSLILGDYREMISEFSKMVGGDIQEAGEGDILPGGRRAFVINLNRKFNYLSDGSRIREDLNYYIDISVIPKIPY